MHERVNSVFRMGFSIPWDSKLMTLALLSAMLSNTNDLKALQHKRM